MFDVEKSIPQALYGTSKNKLQVLAHVIRGVMGILHNVLHKCPETKQTFRDLDAVTVLNLYMHLIDYKQT